MKKLLVLFLLLIAATASADTRLLGNPYTAGDPYNCWYENAGTIEQGRWKAHRLQAVASGTINTSDYFRYEALNNPTGCTSDTVCFVVYEGGTGSRDVGPTKFYGCHESYDWTTIGIGAHDFQVTNVIDGSIVEGEYYWIVMYAYAIDTTEYSNAGCSNTIYMQRGRSTCSEPGFQVPTGSMISTPDHTPSTFPLPAADTDYSVQVETYYAVSLWDGEVTEPKISKVSDTLVHRNAVIIEGENFGSKSPAAPLVWDDGSESTNLSTYYDAWLPTNAQQGEYYNLSYRQIPFRGIEAPHDHIQYIIGGAHATNSQAGSYNSGGNVGLGKNISSHSYFIQYYYRIDPLFEEENHPDAIDNMKEIVLSNTPGSFYPSGWGAFGYVDWCNSDVPDVNQQNDIRLGRIPIDPSHQSALYRCSGNNLVYHNNPINDWIKMQWEGAYNLQFNSPQVFFTTYPDGKRTSISHYGDGLTFVEAARGPWIGYPKLNDLRFIGLGGFARVPRLNNGVSSFRYFAGIYIDSTLSRVMLGDNPNYSNCTILEPQIPSSWTTNSINVTVNLGRFTDTDTAYLFVFNSSNVRNVTGYPVSINTSSSNYATLPTIPTNLRIAN